MKKFINCADSANIINIQHFSVDDGPGIRTTVFLKGCPLHCAWCHNPESQAFEPELMYRADKCRLCGACVLACPNLAHEIRMAESSDGLVEAGAVCDAHPHLVKRELCGVCGKCGEVCSFGALEISGKQMTIDEVMAEVIIDRTFCDLSGGGVTVSGGEPLAQANFSIALLKMCREAGIHTCVETCGYGSTEKLLEMAKYTDLFLFDYKLTDDEKHRAFTGVSNEKILANLDELCRNGANVILRCPMIPDVNVEEAHFDGIAGLANRYPVNIKEIHLEPYHPLGVSKAESIGKSSAYERKEFLDRGELEPVVEYIQSKVGTALVKMS